MKLKRRKRLSKTFKILLIATLVISWTLSSWPAIPFFDFPLTIKEVRAAQQEYTTGSGQFTAQVTGDHVITLVGGGGGGGGPAGGTNGLGGGGGGGGGLCQVTVSLTQGNDYNYAVGVAGTAGGGDGGPGGDTTFVVGGTTYYAYGGDGGLDYDSGATGGTGGGALDCTTTNTGGTGGTGGSGSGGGGSGAGTSGNGNNGVIPTGGAAVADYGGKGGDGNNVNNGSGSPGEQYGGGGGGGVGKNGNAAAGYAGYIIITWSDPSTITQNDWRIYVDNNALDPTDPWGNPDLGENASLTAVPPSNDPIDVGDNIRIRITMVIGTSTLSADSEGFILQYGEGTTCSSISSWTDVDAISGSGTWRYYDNGSITDGTALSIDPPNAGDLNIGVSDRAGRYVESDPTSTNPFDVAAGEDMEWDFNVQYNGNAEAHTYCFRLRKDDPADLDGYNAGSYPQVDIRPTTSDLMRHGNFFTSGLERGFFWAD